MQNIIKTYGLKGRFNVVFNYMQQASTEMDLKWIGYGTKVVRWMEEETATIPGLSLQGKIQTIFFL